MKYNGFSFSGGMMGKLLTIMGSNGMLSLQPVINKN